jgi:hypothetical protein
MLNYRAYPQDLFVGSDATKMELMSAMRVGRGQ